MTDPISLKKKTIQDEVLRAGFDDEVINGLAKADELDLRELVQRATELDQANQPATTGFGTIQSDSQRARPLLIKIYSHWPDGLPAE